MKIIEVEKLSKLYHLGGESRVPYRTLREGIAEFFNSKQKKSGDAAGSFYALRNVNFSVSAGDRVGVVGRNGAGKSTLLKVLSRITEPTSGRVELRGRVASLLEVGTGFHPELTGRENIYLNGSILGMSRKEIANKFDEIVDFAEVERFLDTPVKRYSSGMYVRLAFAVAAHLEPEILVVDEVLAVGDQKFQKKCLGKMEDVSKQQGRTVLFVSHDLSAVQRLCNKVIVLDKGQVVFDGDAADGLSYYSNTQSYSKEKSITGEVVTYLRAEQVGDVLELECHYKGHKTIQEPMFGFIVYDQLNHPIFGATSEHLPPAKPLEASKEGILKLQIEHPKLLDGVYSVSVEFNDGPNSLYNAYQVIHFEVLSMVKYERTPYPALAGVVSPKINWKQEVPVTEMS